MGVVRILGLGMWRSVLVWWGLIFIRELGLLGWIWGGVCCLGEYIWFCWFEFVVMLMGVFRGDNCERDLGMYFLLIYLGVNNFGM